MAELVDAQDLKSCSLCGSVGSTPTRYTKFKSMKRIINWFKELFEEVLIIFRTGEKSQEPKREWRREVTLWKSTCENSKYHNRVWIKSELALREETTVLCNSTSWILVASPTLKHVHYAYEEHIVATIHGAKFEQGKSINTLWKLENHWHIKLYDFIYEDDMASYQLLLNNLEDDGGIN